MLMSKTQGGVSYGFKGKVWYSKVPMGHNTLGKIISEMMKEAGFEGHYTNHSLRVTSATRDCSMQR